MPSKKRARPTSGVDDSAAQPKPFSLERYHLLPLELQHLIISFACLHPTPGTPSALTPFASDSATVIALCLVNRELRQLVQHRLYREVSVTRPSKLYALHQALVERPEMGKLIERLHIGPQDILPSHWWPLSNAYRDGYSWENPGAGRCGGPFNWIETSLRKSQLPSGYGRGALWALDRLPSGCREAAIRDAIESAEHSLGAGLLADRGTGSTDIGPILEVQAALDLYLIKIRTMEAKDPQLLRLSNEDARVPLRCRNGKCDHYPTLVVTQVASRVSNPDQDAGLPGGTYTVSRAELLRHIARPGADADRFDHPLIFERSGYRIYLTTPPGKGHAEHDPVGARYTVRCRSGYIIPVYRYYHWPDYAALSVADAFAAHRPGGQALNTTLIRTATMQSIICLAWCVLMGAPNLKGLSLTGILEHVVGAGHPAMPSLRDLSLGPPPVFDYSYEASTSLFGLDGVEDLRFAGMGLAVGAAWNNLIKMTKLRRLEYSLKEELSYDNAPPGAVRFNIVEAIEGLLKHNNADFETFTPSETSPSPSEDATRTGEESESPSPPDNESTSPSSKLTPSNKRAVPSHSPSPSQAAAAQPLQLVVRLPAAEFGQVLASAPSEEVQEAWLEGRATGSSSPATITSLLLLQGHVPNDGGSGGGAGLRPSQNSASRAVEEFYKEAREWWARAGDAQ